MGNYEKEICEWVGTGSSVSEALRFSVGISEHLTLKEFVKISVAL